MSDTYNGWSNHATWKIHLEYQDLIEDYLNNLHGMDDYDRGQQLKDHFTEMVFEGFDSVDIGFKDLFESAVNLLLQEVNWREIASHYPEPESETEPEPEPEPEPEQNEVENE